VTDTGEGHDLAELIRRLGAGEGDLSPRVFDRIYRELRVIAARQMAGERKGHTLQPTALVNEAYLRLFGREDLRGKSLGSFYRAAAEAMRRILVEHARKRARHKRGGGWERAPLGVADLLATDDFGKIVAIDDAIRRLGEEDAAAARVVKLRFFAGLSVEETARALESSPRTVMRDWSYAKAWLYKALKESDG